MQALVRVAAQVVRSETGAPDSLQAAELCTDLPMLPLSVPLTYLLLHSYFYVMLTMQCVHGWEVMITMFWLRQALHNLVFSGSVLACSPASK